MKNASKPNRARCALSLSHVEGLEARCLLSGSPASAQLLEAGSYQIAKNVQVVSSIALKAAANQSATAGIAKLFSLGSFTTVNTTSPYTVTVNWGDATAVTKFTITNVGTIPARSHTYAKAGTDTVSVIVTDSKAHSSNTTKFAAAVAVPATASIAGNVFKDINANAVKNTGEAGLASVKLFVDANKDGVFNTGEKTVTADASGNFKFSSLLPGTYRVRQVVPTGYKATAPTAGYFDVPVTVGAAIVGKTFADAPATASISGVVFGDSNSNGLLDGAETGLAGWQVYIDANKNAKYDTGDTLATTAAGGKWSFKNLVAGTYAVRIVQVAGTTTTAPASGALTVPLTAGQSIANQRFGEKRIVQNGFVLQAPTITVAASSSTQVVSVPITLTFAAGQLPFNFASVDFGLAITTPANASPLQFLAVTSLLSSFAVSPTPSTTNPPAITSTIGFSAADGSGKALSGTSVTVAVFQFRIPASTPAGTVYKLSFTGTPDISDTNFNEPTLGIAAGSITIKTS